MADPVPPEVPGAPASQPAPGTPVGQPAPSAPPSQSVSDSLSGQPAADAPPAGSPVPGIPTPAEVQGRHKLHHSYIWLGSLRALPSIFIAFVTVGFSSVASLAANGGASGLPFSGPAFIVLVVLGILLFMVLILALCVGFTAWSWRYIWYEFDDTEFSYYSGILNKRRVHVPYQKVQSVNEKATLLQRAAGVCTVVIETAGGSANKAVRVAYVERSAAEVIRRELYLRKRLMNADAAPRPAAALPEDGAAGMAQPSAAALLAAGSVPGVSSHLPARCPLPRPAPPPYAANALDAPAAFAEDLRGVFAGDEVDTGEVTYEFGLTNKELILSAVTGKSSFVIVLVGFIASLSSVISFVADAGFVPTEDAVYEQAWHSLSAAGPAAALVGACAIVAAFAVAWVIYLVGALLSYGGFRARRRGSRIEVERGMLTHLFSGVDVERIQSVHIHQSFFQRILKCCSVSYGRIAAGPDEYGSNSSSGADDKLIVHPFVPLSRAHEVISQLTPEFATLPRPDRPVSPRALRRSITRRAIIQGGGFWLAVAALICTACVGMLRTVGAITDADASFLHVGIASLLILAALIFVVEVIGAVLWYRRASFGMGPRCAVLVNGGYSVETTFLPRTKIQLAGTRSNPLQRHARVATLFAKSAAGVGGQKERLIDVSETDAVLWRDWVRPGTSGRL